MKHRNYDVRKPQNRRLSPSLLLVSLACRGAQERAALEAAEALAEGEQEVAAAAAGAASSTGDQKGEEETPQDKGDKVKEKADKAKKDKEGDKRADGNPPTTARDRGSRKSGDKGGSEKRGSGGK